LHDLQNNPAKNYAVDATYPTAPEPCPLISNLGDKDPILVAYRDNNLA
jgi:hypothetical protein